MSAIFTVSFGCEPRMQNLPPYQPNVFFLVLLLLETGEKVEVGE